MLLKQDVPFRMCWYDETAYHMLKDLNGWATPYEASAYWFGKTGKVEMSTETLRRHFERLTLNGFIERDVARSPWSSNAVTRYRYKTDRGCHL